MMIMPDLEDPFLPLGEGLFVDPYESKAVISSLLTRLPQMFSAIKNPEPALLSGLNSALAALEKTGGRVVCACSALPTWGPGRLFMRDDGNHPGGELDKKLYTTEHPAWKKVAEKMAASGIGADFFLAAPSGGYLDIATIGKFWSNLYQRILADGKKGTLLLRLAARLTTTLTSLRLETVPRCLQKSPTL